MYKMEKINRLMINICSANVMKSRDFYIQLFDFEVSFDSDWFVQLVSKDKNLELGIIDKTNDMVPKDVQNNPQGFYITFVVDNVDEVYVTAKSKQLEIVSEPRDTFYGQRQLLLKDPDGALLDISSPIKGFKF